MALATPKYRISITQHNTEGPLFRPNVQVGERTVEANLPESVGFGIEAVWESRIPNSIADVIPGILQQFGTAGDVFGISTVFQRYTQTTWQGTSPIQMDLELLFNAEEDAQTEVYDNMKRLAMMAMPTISSWGTMVSPGPTIWNPTRKRVSMRIGNFLFFPSVVLTKVDLEFDTMYDAKGVPISGKANITFRTIDTYASEQLDAAMGIRDWEGAAP